MLTVKTLNKKYGKKDKVTALCDVSFEMPTGSILCILGHNGAGKTTLVKSIAGILTPDSGEIYLNHVNIVDKPKYARRTVGIVLEGSRNIYHYLTARDNIKYFSMLNELSSKIAQERTEYYLNLFGLTEAADRAVNTFSRGMQQKVAIMVALIKDPDILLLDEPTLGLDIVSAEMVKDILIKLARDTKKTIIIPTHDISLIQSLNSRLLFMNRGRIVKDTHLSELGRELMNKDEYEIHIDNTSNPVLPDDYQASENTFSGSSVLVFKTQSVEWVKENIGSSYVLNITKSQNAFESMYKSIMSEAELYD